MKSGVVFLQRVDDGRVRQARDLRRNMTEAEKMLWQRIRNRQIENLKFRRQQVIEGFIADFYCEELKLAVEIDGGIHLEREKAATDRHRDEVFRVRGIRVLRVKNDAVLNNITEVLERIRNFKEKAM
jgi:very-short-patch-repair endonuclease